MTTAIQNAVLRSDRYAACCVHCRLLLRYNGSLSFTKSRYTLPVCTNRVHGHGPCTHVSKMTPVSTRRGHGPWRR